MRPDVLQGADDVGWNWWWGGQILARWPVTVLIGDPGESVHLTLGIVVLEVAVGHHTAQARLGVRDSVGGLVGVAVGSVVVHFALLLQDLGITIDVAGGGNGENGGDHTLKRMERMVR